MANNISIMEALRIVSKTAQEYTLKNIPHVISEDVVLTIPAASIVKADYESAIANNNSYFIPITGAVPTINSDDLYVIKYNNAEYEAFVHNEPLGLAVDDPNCIMNFIFSYDSQQHPANESADSDMQDRVASGPNPPFCQIDKLNVDNITDIEVKSIKIQKLHNKFLESDLKIKNSISMNRTGVIGDTSTAVGSMVEASGIASHAEGTLTKATGRSSHVEGTSAIASGFSSHAEGLDATASGYVSHAEGDSTTASGNFSHAEGDATTAAGYASHSEGTNTTASGSCSHAEGCATTASSNNQHVQGKFNIEDTEGKYAHIVGNGSSLDNKSNAHTLDWNGNGWYAGKLSQEGTPTEDKDLVTKKYFDENSTNVADGFVMNDQVNGNKYLIQMKGGVLTSILLPTSISVDTSSLQGVTFMEGDAIDPETLTFMANYPDGTSSKITDTENLSYAPSELTTDVTQISFVYSIGGLKLTYDMPITVTAFDPAVKLQDFEYTANNDGTYTLTGWKETHNGVASTELIIPNNKKIIL